MPVVKFFKLSDKATIPFKGTVGSAGVDLSAAEQVTVPARGTALVSTELGCEIPPGFWGFLTSRSGLARNGIVSEAGVIDSDYRGNLWIILYNHTDKDYVVRERQRCAQMIVQPYMHPMEIRECSVKEATETKRGEGAFGSTGSGMERSDWLLGSDSKSDSDSEMVQDWEEWLQRHHS